MTLKPILITCGEPTGIGPELVAKAWSFLKNDLCFFWLGDPKLLPKNTNFETICSPNEAIEIMPHALPVMKQVFPRHVSIGQPDLENSAMVIEILEKAVSIIKEGLVKGICTSPINKHVLKEGADFRFPGQTEFFASKTNTRTAVMMLAAPELRVVPTTIHAPLHKVNELLTAQLLERTINITHSGLSKLFKIKEPRLVVTGLNPHAGENGVFGKEEIELIQPVIKRLKIKGMNIMGPYSADSLFHSDIRQSYDAAITMYHDQALIPIKTLFFQKCVNITLGLPFIRTSPDHGTAFDIAGKGIANPSSMIEAIKLIETLDRQNEIY